MNAPTAGKPRRSNPVAVFTSNGSRGLVLLTGSWPGWWPEIDKQWSPA